MKYLALSLPLLMILLPASARPASDAPAQPLDRCPEPIYRMDQVTTRAQILQIERPPYPPELFNSGNGRIRLEAILCKTGKVTNIQVLESNLPTEVRQRCIDVVARVKFVPARKNDRPVSQRFRFRFTFELRGTPSPSPNLPQPPH